MGRSISFNPCFNGLVVQTNLILLSLIQSLTVSILVLMDSSFKLDWDTQEVVGRRLFQSLF